MKRILITGENSYIGTSFKKWASQWKEQYAVDVISTIDEHWKNKSFNGYDVVLHVAAIVHQKENNDKRDLYMAINYNMAVEMAKKSKADGVSQFVFLSTMAVFGTRKGCIDKDTKRAAKTLYGQSKWAAEEEIYPLQSNVFNVVIIRPPSVYGKNCKGGYYSAVSIIAQKLPIFPNINNARSMIYIDNLCEFIRLMIQNEEKGIFHPQNTEYVNITSLVKNIAAVYGRNIVITKILNPFIAIMKVLMPKAYGLFGSLTYDMSLSVYKDQYNVYGFVDSINASEASGKTNEE